MNSSRTTPSSQRLMTSKFRFRDDGTRRVYSDAHFSKLSSLFLLLLDPSEPHGGPKSCSSPTSFHAISSPSRQGLETLFQLTT